MKIQLSVKVDELVARHAKRQPNTSRYIEMLIKQDMQLKAQEPIYEAITVKMLKDAEFIGELKSRLTGTTYSHYYKTSAEPTVTPPEETA